MGVDRDKQIIMDLVDVLIKEEVTFDDAVRLLETTKASVFIMAEENDVILQDYKPKDLKDFVPCRRCEFSKKEKDGQWRCTCFYFGPKREVYYVAPDDGCSRGSLKAHYRRGR